MVRTIHMNSKLREQHLFARKALETVGNIAFKPESSAKWVDISRSWKGNVLVQIEHDNIKNVTPEIPSDISHICTHKMGPTAHFMLKQK